MLEEDVIYLGGGEQGPGEGGGEESRVVGIQKSIADFWVTALSALSVLSS
ncbi:hypothetical protein Sjap_019404 [Stephania japonica]|uniref:Uncharacterized protein n=1 Tax=Stephania japonica TaxID=461633 RepID=A0AAP0HZG6_9MAGN